MTGSVTSKDSTQPSKKPHPPSTNGGLFGELGEEVEDGEEDEDGDLFDQPTAKKTSEPKKKVFTSSTVQYSETCLNRQTTSLALKAPPLYNKDTL